ncbi:MAG: SfnB family sulfur acquisition oxidoreductase [Thermoleophilia bacterium]
MGTAVTVPVLGDAEAIAEAARIAEDLARGDAERDRRRILPRDEVASLARAGLLAITVPPESGGPGAGARTVGEVLVELSAGDASVGQIPQNHFFFVDVLRHAGTADQRGFFHGEILAGRWFGNAISERGGRTALDFGIGFRRTPGGRVIDGAKHYATGSLFAQWIPIYANDERGLLHAAFVPADAPGVTRVDDWDGMGQRTTGSGTVRFDAVEVPEDHVVPVHRIFEGPETFGAFGNYMHAAIDAGIAVAALRDGGRLVRELARPWWEAEVESAADEPAVVQEFGELALRVRAARALVREAGEAIDAARQSLDERSAAEASAAVAAARAAADTAAVSVAGDVFALVGTRAAADALNLHRHWRNARTHTLHDPRRWKVRHLGAWELSGTPPPANGIV